MLLRVPARPTRPSSKPTQPRAEMGMDRSQMSESSCRRLAARSLRGGERPDVREQPVNTGNEATYRAIFLASTTSSPSFVSSSAPLRLSRCSE